MDEEPSVEDVAVALQLSIGLCLRRMRHGQAQDALTLPEASALKRLERGGPATVTALAKEEQISVQSIGATLAGLQTRGLLERRPIPATAAARSWRSRRRGGRRWPTSTMPARSSWSRPCRPGSPRPSGGS